MNYKISSKKKWLVLICCFASITSEIFGETDNKITLAWENMPKSFDSRYATDANSQYLEDLIHCSLISFDQNGKTIPELATSWQWVNNTQLSMSISKKFKFNDGAVVTPKDIFATYEQLISNKLPRPSARALAFKNLKKIEYKEKDYQINFFLNAPDSAFITNLVIGIQKSESDFSKILKRTSKNLGCGPFKLAKSTLTRLELVKNQYHPDSTQNTLEKVEIKIVKDETTRFAKLRKGELNLVQNELSLDRATQIIKKIPRLRIERRPALKTTYIGFNFKDKILSNRKVRQAIAHAIDRETIIKYIFKGFASKATGLLPNNNEFALKTPYPYQYSKERANVLLDEAGFKRKNADEMRFTLTYKTSQNATRVMIAKAIASQLKKVGIDLKVQSLEWGRFTADIAASKFQLWGLSWIGFKDPDILRYAFASDQAPPNGGNRGRFSNAQLDKILDNAIQVTDEKQRIALYHKAQDIIREELPYVFLWHSDNFAIIDKQIENFTVYADGRYSSLRKVKMR